MKRLFISLLVLLLLISSFSSSNIVLSGVAMIGPGIDNNLPAWEEAKYGPNGDAPFTKFYIEFNAPSTAEYTFHIGFGVLENDADGMIRFILTDTNNTEIREHVVIVSGSIPFHDETLFTVNLTAGTYRLWIVKTSDDEDIADFNGTIILWMYDKAVDDSVSYYWWQDYSVWFVTGDIAWYATYYGISGSVPIPQVKIVNRWQDDKGVHYTLKLWNWKNGSTVRIQQIDSYYKTLKNEYVFDIPDSSQYLIVNITLEYIDPGDQLIARGYGIDGSYHKILIKTFNETYRKLSIIDQIKLWFSTLYSYAWLIFATVKSIVPYAGIFYMLALFGTFFQCIKELSIMPLFDFFVKQYNMLVSLANITLKIAEKVYQGLKILAQAIITIIASLI